MSLRVRLLIAAIAVCLSLFATFGDFFFVGVLGLTPGSGRIVVAATLLVIGVVWFVWSGAAVRKTLRDVRNRRSKD
jgi:hypothetical protein